MNEQIEEKTLVLVKPDGVKRGLVGEIITRFEKVGLRIVGSKVVKVESELAFKHYGANDEWFENVGNKVRDFYNKIGYDPGEEISKMSNRQIGEMIQKWNADFLQEGPVVALVFHGAHAVQIVRKIVGSTYPSDALPGTIRGDYSTESALTGNLDKRAVRNLVHASGTPDEAKMEIELWFKEGEVLD